MSLWARIKYCWEKKSLSAFWDCMSEDEVNTEGLDKALNELHSNIEQATQATNHAMANRAKEKEANKEFRCTLKDVLKRIQNEQTQ